MNSDIMLLIIKTYEKSEGMELLTSECSPHQRHRPVGTEKKDGKTHLIKTDCLVLFFRKVPVYVNFIVR